MSQESEITSEVLNALQETQVDAPAKTRRAGGGNIATLRFVNPSTQMNLMAKIRHKEVPVEPLIDMESGIKRVGPNNAPVIAHRTDHYFELNKEIMAAEMRYVQDIDGTLETVSKLSMTNVVDVTEGRPIEECTLLDESETVHKSLGTTIPLPDVQRYVPDAVHAAWPADDSQAWATVQLAEYLERQRIALIFPFTHGNGFKIHTTLLHPVRWDGELYLLWSNCRGELMHVHPLKATEEQSLEKKVVSMAMPRLRVVKKKQGQ